NIEYDYLGKDENCCGGLLYRLGFKKEFEQIMKENIQILKKYKRIILICPGCYSTFINFYNRKLKGIEIKHLIEILDEKQNLKEFLTDKKITYHDPCHLSRDLGLIEPPRNILKRLGLFEEMKMNSELSRCCGAGGGVLSIFPELSNSMAKTRLNDACMIKDLDYLLTACPFCEYNLKKSKTNDMNFQIMSIQEFIINRVKFVDGIDTLK
ncbi:MAG: (Fe-S)-binding protein, partial [Candidatus Helarchaeota archaeon]